GSLPMTLSPGIGQPQAASLPGTIPDPDDTAGRRSSLFQIETSSPRMSCRVIGAHLGGARRSLRGTLGRDMETPATLIASVQRALRLLEAVAVSPGESPAKQLARTVGLPIGTTYHLLRTLTFEGYLQRLADGGYVLGDEVARLLESGDLKAVRQRIRPALAALRDEARAPAYFAIY